MANSHQIRTATLLDIVFNVPEENHDACIDELKVLVRQLTATRNALLLYGIADDEVMSAMPDTATWIDDGVASSTINFKGEDQDVSMTLKESK